jgi:hypothetical protein
MQKARFQTIKGTTYVYLETSHRVPGKKYPNHKRIYIGKMADGQFVPNANFFALSPERQQASGVDWKAVSPEKPRGRPPAALGVRKFRGSPSRSKTRTRVRAGRVPSPSSKSNQRLTAEVG